jgi:glycosyltransferase involved in cell wall biosynthesis
MLASKQPAAETVEVTGIDAIRRFDGVVCFGGSDWWYHNRGHYDIQMMRQLSRRTKVIYVNSIGVRIPRLGERAVFVRRVIRKLKSLTRGFVRIHDRFAVLSPLSIPGSGGIARSRKLLGLQVRLAAHRMGMSHPLIWVECPTAAVLLDSADASGLVYQRTDRYENFPGADIAAIKQFDAKLKQRADVTLFCSKLLYAEEALQCRQARYVDHGVDYPSFAATGDDHVSEPQDVRGIPRPRIGFVGGIDSHTFDPQLFRETAGRMHDCEFVLVGACSLPADWCTLPNVHLLGQRAYEDVAKYMAACDVLIMPWNQNEWIKACNPVKLKEYLAVGRPVVSTDFAELAQYEGLVRRARDSASFVEQIRLALLERPNVALMRQRVASETWEAKAQAVLSHLAALGLRAEAAC